MIATVADPSQVAQARRRVTEFAGQAGASQAKLDHIAIAVTELATNLLKHAAGGEILAERFHDRDGIGVDVLALDRGNGMADVDRCMQDGYSSAGSLGQGLGAVSRQADTMRIWSQPDRGTVILARFVLQASPTASRLQCGSATSAYPGETVCGDAWAFADTAAGPALLVADGTGHGLEAARAANLAVDIFCKHPGETCEELVHRMHRALVPTRGAALAVARIDAAAQLIRYAGIGNISATMIAGGEVRHMVSNNGIAGHLSPRVREFNYPFGDPPLLILHSDGISTRWDLNAYPGLTAQHPSLVAGVLLRDFRRGRDDASVVALRMLQ
ncbi:MAG TPA: ATP-binding SpoIIE family protein phosphatase [Acetobacteraceae bacterium]